MLTLTTSQYVLTARVYNGPARKSAKVRSVSEVVIHANGVPVAKAVLGGRYNPEQGLAEFHRHPDNFQPLNGIKLATLIQWAETL